MHYLVLLAPIFFIANNASANSEKENANLIQRTLKSTVIIESILKTGEAGFGSGFFIDEKGSILTNHHVVTDSKELSVRLIGGKSSYVGSVSSISEKHDLAIIKTSINNPSLQLADDSEVKVGDEVYAIGNPYGLQGTVSKGIVSAIREYGKFDKIFQITAPISRGSSGGPVINSSGEVIAVAVAGIVEGQNLNFAIPISYIAKLNGDSDEPSSEKLKLLQMVKSIEDNEDNFLLRALSKALHHTSDKLKKIDRENSSFPKILESNGVPYSGWIDWSNPPLITGISEYKDGLVDGISASWGEDGIIFIQTHRQGFSDGILKSYFDDVKKPFRLYYVKNGKRHGVYKEWFPDGEIWRIQKYKMGKLHGDQQYFYYGSQVKQFEKYFEEGKLLSLIGWKTNGQRSPSLISKGKGKSYTYNPRNGNLHYIEEFSKGEQTSKTTFYNDGINKYKHAAYENWDYQKFKGTQRVTYWHRNGTKESEFLMEDLDYVSGLGWDPQGKRDETKISNGNGKIVFYSENGDKRIFEVIDGRQKSEVLKDISPLKARTPTAEELIEIEKFLKSGSGEDSKFKVMNKKAYGDIAKRWVEIGPELVAIELQNWARKRRFGDAIEIFEILDSKDKATIIAFLLNSKKSELIELADALAMRERDFISKP